VTIPFPKEHGVWAMLAASIITGAAIAGSFRPMVLSTAAGLSLLFMAKAPLKSILRNLAGKNSFAWLSAYVLAAVPLLFPLLPHIPAAIASLAALVTIAVGPVYVLAMRNRTEMRISSEIPAMAVIALAAPFANAAAGGESSYVMSSIWLLGLLYYSASSFRVRTVPGSNLLRPALAYYAVLAIGLGIAAAGGKIPALAAIAFMPLLENAYRTFRPSREKLSLLGRIELVKLALFTALMIAGFVRT